jgi:hypothetical protein
LFFEITACEASFWLCLIFQWKKSKLEK